MANYYIDLVFRIIPAFLYPIAISSALTIVAKISPQETNKVLLGVSTGNILGFSITSYLGFTYGYNFAILWFCIVNIGC